MSVREDLIAAKALIDSPEKWTKGKLQNEMGTCFCTAGALIVAEDMANGPRPDMWRHVVAALPESVGGSIVTFNDDPSTTHADIMALFDRAIAAAGDA